MKNILIVGTGALATLFAARLAAAGSHVTMLGTWKKAIKTLNREGARLVESDGSGLQFPVRATQNPADCVGSELALVLVKAWQTRRAAEQLERCLSAQGLALTLQNGLGNSQILADHLGAERTILGSTTSGATLLGPGLVRMGGSGLTSLEMTPRSGEISEVLRSAGMQVEIVADANALVWGKLVINAAINPLTALLKVTNGALLERSSARMVMAALARETAAVASARGVHLPFSDPVMTVEDVARQTAGNRSSMLQDVERSAQTEIDAICGEITRAGDECGVAVPVNRTMWQLLSALHPA